MCASAILKYPRSGARLVANGNDDYVLLLEFAKSGVLQATARRGQVARNSQDVDDPVHFAIAVDVDPAGANAADGPGEGTWPIGVEGDRDVCREVGYRLHMTSARAFGGGW